MSKEHADNNQNFRFFRVTNNNNHPVIRDGDAVGVDISVDEFDGPHDLELRRINSKGVWHLDKDMFEPTGLIIQITRPAPH